MVGLRSSKMADILYERGQRRSDRGNFAPPIPIFRSPKFQRHKAPLQRAIEFDIVPRLLGAHPPVETLPRHEPLNAAVEPGIIKLAELVLGRDADAASQHVHGLIDQGMNIEAMFLKLIAPTAIHLKQLWMDDERDFAEVTLGLWRLQHLLREFSLAFRHDAKKNNGNRVLLTLPPGETHELPYLLFSLVLTGEFFRRDGWATWIEPDCARFEAMSLVRRECFDVVEILVNGEKRLELLAAQIRTIRNESINRSVCIAVTGDAVHQHPELVKYLDADVLADGAENAGAMYAISTR